MSNSGDRGVLKPTMAMFLSRAGEIMCNRHLVSGSSNPNTPANAVRIPSSRRNKWTATNTRISLRREAVPCPIRAKLRR